MVTPEVEDSQGFEADAEAWGRPRAAMIRLPWMSRSSQRDSSRGERTRR